MLAPHFNADLVRQYDVTGPRYTSYPTADRFSEGDWLDAYQDAISRSEKLPLSLYVHIPFCPKICFYCACTKINTANAKRADSYVKHLASEMALQSALIDGPHEVEQLHFGGGTPTFLNDEQFYTLFDSMRRYFSLTEDPTRDYSIEVDPRNLRSGRITTLATLGINRLSIGVQDFDPAVQVAVNRIQTIEETSAVVDEARSCGIESISFDLINGLPKQTLSGFSRTLEKVIELQPDRLSLYSYAHLPHRFKSQKQIRFDELPDAQSKLGILEAAVRLLTSAGYCYIGMDHFAKQTDSLVEARRTGALHRNFQGYTTHSHCQLIGLGQSSIGNVGRVYVQNSKVLHEYYESVDAGRLAIVRGYVANDQDVIVGQVIKDLMCKFEVNFQQFRDAFGIDFKDYFSDQWPRLVRFEKDGLLSLETGRIKVTEQGRFLVRIVCMAFDTHLSHGSAQFSRAI